LVRIDHSNLTLARTDDKPARSGIRSRDPFNFFPTNHVSGIGKARHFTFHFKFCVPIDIVD